MPQRRSSKRDEVEAWWAFLARVLAFFFGAYLIYQEAQPPPGVEEWILMAGVGCMGPAVATQVVSVIEAVRGKPGRLPAPEEPVE